jgi:MoaA/NifB/PqqE/SkfB family radical SAM enzyme
MREFDVYSYEAASRSCGRISRTFSRDLSAIGMDEKTIPPGYFCQFAEDNVKWLREEGLCEPCNAGRSSIAIDASGNVVPRLALPAAGNLFNSLWADISSRSLIACISRCAPCRRAIGSMVWSGSILRHLITAWRNPVLFR